MADNMVKLATFGSLEEAFMVKNLLDEEGVQAFAVGETNGGLWQLNALVGGGSVYVPAEAVEHAHKVLADHANSEPMEPTTHIRDKPAAEAPTELETGITEEAPDPEPTEADFAAADEEEEDESPITESSPGEVMATRAFRSAVIGLVISSLSFVFFAKIFWVLFTGYSVYLLVQLGRWRGDLGRTGHRNMLLAAILNGISVVTYLTLTLWRF
jgi:hypothetical protein